MPRAECWTALCGLVEHCALETYSVLTRLPALHGRGDVVRNSWRHDSPAIPPTERSGLPGLLAALARPREISGGASYDGLVAATAASHGAELVRAIGAPRCLRTVRCASSPV